MNNKKAQSNVVSTVLIILLVVAAIAIIGVIVLNVVNKSGSTISASVACQDIDVHPVKCNYNDTVVSALYNIKYSQNLSLRNVTLIFTDSSGNAQTLSVDASQTPNLVTSAFSYAISGTVPAKFSTSANLRTVSGQSVSCPASVPIKCSLSNGTLAASSGGVPNSITSLILVSKGIGSIYWSWINPTSPGFSQAIIYINSVNVANISGNAYNATGLSPNTPYTININTKDTNGRVNNTVVSNTQTTFASTYPLTVSVVQTGYGTVTSNPAGINCNGAGVCSVSFPYGSTVILSQVPSAGRVFSGWSAGCSGVGACSLFMNRSQAVTGNFH